MSDNNFLPKNQPKLLYAVVWSVSHIDNNSLSFSNYFEVTSSGQNLAIGLSGFHDQKTHNNNCRYHIIMLILDDNINILIYNITFIT